MSLDTINDFEANKMSSTQESLLETLEKLPIELLPIRSHYTLAELEEMMPNDPIVVCDFYIPDIEKGENLESGYKKGRVTNIDHHAPVAEMARQVSSTNLTIEFVKENGAVVPPAHVVIHHTDCDSTLSSAIVRGILPPLDKFGEAAIAADHTGAANNIADLLQSLTEERDLSLSLGNLEKLLKDEPLDEKAQNLLDKRLKDRERASKLIKKGEAEKIGHVYCIYVESSLDGELLPALLPDAEVIIIGTPMKDDPKKWEIRVRLGMKAPENFKLNAVNLPDFGGRWNAGSTRRHGGTKLNPREYAAVINKIIEEQNKD